MDDIEYIFVDDCSPDKSIAILENIIKEYQPRLNKEHKNVRIEKMSQNSGLPNVRRYGIKLATGDYIAHCDSDDWVELGMYQQMYNKAIEEDADVIGLLYRDGYYREREEKEDIVDDVLEINFAKCRNGRTGVVELNYNLPTQRLSEF